MKKLSEKLDKHLQNLKEGADFREVVKFIKSHKNTAPVIAGNISTQDEEYQDSFIKLISSALNNSELNIKALNDFIEELKAWVINAPYSTEKDNPEFFDEWREGVIRVAKKLNIPVSKLGVIDGADEEADMYDYYQGVVVELPRLLKIINTDIAKRYETKLIPYINKAKNKAKFVVSYFELE